VVWEWAIARTIRPTTTSCTDVVVRRTLYPWIVCAVAACSRKDAATGLDAAVDGAVVSSMPLDASAPAVTSESDAGITPRKVTAAELRRLRANGLGDIPLLDTNAKALLEKHFSGTKGPFDVQLGELSASGRLAVLVTESGKIGIEARPIALVIREDGAVLWSKERPVAGIMPPAFPIAIAPAPLGRVALAACDPPTSAVALRLWDDDGSPFADFQALTDVDSCDALSLLYWPGHGWLIVTARPGATRARLVNENGAPVWGQPLDLGVRSRPGAPAVPSVAADTDDSFVLVQIAQPTAAPGSPFHALAFRYDARGAAIWKEAVDLGEVPAPGAGGRATLVPMKPGVRVTLPSGGEIELRPSGDHVTRGRAPR
jgi:hypothetical protein